MNENYYRRKSVRNVFAAGLVILNVAALSACAEKTPGKPIEISKSDTSGITVVQEKKTPSERDILEPLNRGVFKFNEVVDGVLIRPMAHIYLGIMPEFGQKIVKNMLANLASPVVFLNSVLQYDPNNAGKTFGRFVINSTVGIAGAFDVAGEFGIKKENKKDFGQTMGVYGAGTGTYIVLPLLGPSDARDTLGLVVDILSDPFTYILTTNESVARTAIDGLVKRADYLPVTDRIYRDSFDPYATFRSVYLQNRDKFVRDYLGSNAGDKK